MLSNIDDSSQSLSRKFLYADTVVSCLHLNIYAAVVKCMCYLMLYRTILNMSNPNNWSVDSTLLLWLLVVSDIVPSDIWHASTWWRVTSIPPQSCHQEPAKDLDKTEFDSLAGFMVACCKALIVIERILYAK